MKVAFITPYPPRRDGIGDYSSKLVAALRRVERDEVLVDVYSLARDGVAEEGQYAILSMSPRSWWRLYRALVSGNYDVVHLQFDLSIYLMLIIPLTLILAAVRFAGDVSIVATYHEAYADLGRYGKLSVAFYNVFTRLFDRVYVHSHRAEKCLNDQYRVSSTKVHRIDHGTFEFSDRQQNHVNLRDRWDLGDAPVLLCFGYIYKSKGIEVLIDAVRMIADLEDSMPQVVIAGEPPKRHGLFRVLQARNDRYLAGLKARVLDEGLEKTVSFVGYVADRELYSLFTLAEVVVLPYLVADQSGVLNIAIAAGTPVIASDVGGIAETLGETGVVVAPGSSVELAGQVRRLLSEPSLRAEMSRAYGQLADRLSTDRVAEALVDDYGRLSAQGARRVVQVSAYYPPHLGGQESVVEQLSQALGRTNIEVDVVSSRLPHGVGHGVDRVQVRRLWAREVAHTPLMPGLPFALARRARGAVVHVHTGQAFVPETVALVCGLMKRPFVSHVHLLVQPSGRFGRLFPLYQRVVFREVLRRSAAVVCLTEDMRQRIIGQYQLSSDQVLVIPNGVDEKWFVYDQRDARPQEILFVGRLTPQKNLAVVIRAMAELSDARLTVIGDGEELPALEKLAFELGLSNVNFVGRQDASAVRSAMLMSSVLVLPSTHEGQPLVILEAEAAGLPVLASDIPELRETVPARCLVSPHEPTAWVTELRRLLGNELELADLSAAGIRRARMRGSWDHLAGEWIELYNSVL